GEWVRARSGSGAPLAGRQRSARTPLRRRRGDSLQHIEALEFRMRERQRPALTGVAMRRAEGLGAGPGLKRRPRPPQGMRRVQHMIVAFRSLEETEFDEAGHGVKIGLAIEPAGLEGALLALADLEAIHRDVHGGFPRAVVRSSRRRWGRRRGWSTGQMRSR